jgi:hypothetical protein
MAEGMPSVYEFSEGLDNAEAPPPLPIGDYRATVQGIDSAISKSSGKPMAVFTYLISPDQYPADFTNGNPDGEQGKVYVSLVDDARNRFRLRKLCEMHGVTASRTLNLPDFLGTEVIVSVTHEEYQGETRARMNPIRQV